jgi:hypothetical protein
VSLYLQGTIPWLFDPAGPELATLAREADARTSSTPCDPPVADVAHRFDTFV